jgi:hypothetical protein
MGEMGTNKPRKELQSPESFRRALAEEMEVSAGYDLPLSVLALRHVSSSCGWSEDAVRRVLGALRIADLACRLDPSELLVALPNTKQNDAGIVEERLRSAVPDASFGVASYAPGDDAGNLVQKARAAVPRTG